MKNMIKAGLLVAGLVVSGLLVKAMGAPSTTVPTATTQKSATAAEVLGGVGNLVFQGSLAWAQVLAARGDTQVKEKLEILKNTSKSPKERADAAAYVEARFIIALQALNPVLDQMVSLAMMADADKGKKLKDEVETYKGYLFYMSIGNEAVREYLAQQATMQPSTPATPFNPAF